jgi:hypothetical protein
LWENPNDSGYLLLISAQFIGCSGPGCDIFATTLIPQCDSRPEVLEKRRKFAIIGSIWNRRLGGCLDGA